MQDTIYLIFAWLIFFASTVGGHVAIKLGMLKSEGLVAGIVSIQSILGFAMWALSAFAWALILHKQSLVAATHISNLRYPLILICALLFLNEHLSTYQIIGSLGVFISLLLISIG